MTPTPTSSLDTIIDDFEFVAVDANPPDFNPARHQTLVADARAELEKLRADLAEALDALADIAGSGLTDDGAQQACEFAEPILRKHERIK